MRHSLLTLVVLVWAWGMFRDDFLSAFEVDTAGSSRPGAVLRRCAAGISHLAERGVVMRGGRDEGRNLPGSPIKKTSGVEQSPLRRLHDFLDEISWADAEVDRVLCEARRAANVVHPETVMAHVWPALRFEEPTHAYRFVRLLLDVNAEVAEGDGRPEPAHRGWHIPKVPAFADLAPRLTAGVLEGLVLAWRRPVPTPLFREELSIP